MFCIRVLLGGIANRRTYRSITSRYQNSDPEIWDVHVFVISNNFVSKSVDENGDMMKGSAVSRDMRR